MGKGQEKPNKGNKPKLTPKEKKQKKKDKAKLASFAGRPATFVSVRRRNAARFTRRFGHEGHEAGAGRGPLSFLSRSEEPMTIYFYSTQGEHGYMSNFSRHPIVIDGKVWPTTEHYFQAQKFAGTEHEGEIRKASGPGEAARMGRDRSRPLRKDWESAKDNIMRVALRAKFTQHEELRVALLSTATEPLVENTTTDLYWGAGSDGTGKNMLGRLLVELRSQLAKE
jgi:ribA/ribD-fused uncharacterized protein